VCRREDNVVTGWGRIRGEAKTGRVMDEKGQKE
jgi:hypothetical protein